MKSLVKFPIRSKQDRNGSNWQNKFEGLIFTILLFKNLTNLLKNALFPDQSENFKQAKHTS